MVHEGRKTWASRSLFGGFSLDYGRSALSASSRSREGWATTRYFGYEVAHEGHRSRGPAYGAQFTSQQQQRDGSQGGASNRKNRPDRRKHDEYPPDAASSRTFDRHTDLSLRWAVAENYWLREG